MPASPGSAAGARPGSRAPGFARTPARLDIGPGEGIISYESATGHPQPSPPPDRRRAPTALRARPRENLIACCGLDCGQCDMRQAAKNPEMQKQFARWFNEHLKLDVEPEQVRCAGCHGPREEHWSPDCWILTCCVDEHGREYCSDCPEFPCRQLRDWAAQSPRYTAALAWLVSRREAEAD